MDIEKLISLINKNTPLWNTKDKRYRHRDMHRKHWTKVAEELGVEVEKVKKKWQGLRDVFRKEYNKAVQGRSGDKTSLKGTSSWPHFDKMLFLKDIVEHRKLQENISSPKKRASRTDHSEQEERYVSDTSNDNDFEFAPSQYSTRGSQLRTDNCQPPTACGVMDPPPTSIGHKRRKQRPDTDDEPFIQTQRKKLKLFSENAAVKEDSDYQFLSSLLPLKEDSDYQFLLSLLPFLRNVSSQRKLTVRHKLQQVFIDEEQNDLRSPTLVLSSQSSSSNEEKETMQSAVVSYITHFIDGENTTLKKH